MVGVDAENDRAGCHHRHVLADDGCYAQRKSRTAAMSRGRQHRTRLKGQTKSLPRGRDKLYFANDGDECYGLEGVPGTFEDIITAVIKPANITPPTMAGTKYGF